MIAATTQVGPTQAGKHCLLLPIAFNLGITSQQWLIVVVYGTLSGQKLQWFHQSNTADEVMYVVTQAGRMQTSDQAN